MSVQADGDELLTIDELGAATGITVRTMRYYTTLGLLPPPTRRGRVAYYSAVHRARLELVKALQDHGFTLSAIERYLAEIPADASVEDLAVQRAMLTSWSPAPPERLTMREVEKKARRVLSAEQVERLVVTGALTRIDDDTFETLPMFDVGVQLLDLDIPIDGLVEANEAVVRHMNALAEELTQVWRRRVLGPYRATKHSEADAAKFERTMSRVRQLTLQAVVSGFQRAADQVISRSLSKD